MDIDLRHLRSFHVLAQELNFTRAAARLHLSQQALSSQVRLLEGRVGAPLFARSTRHVALTDAGRTLLGHVPSILLAVGQAVAETRDAASGVRGSLSVGLAGAAGLGVTPRILRSFAGRHADASVSVRTIDFDDSSAGLTSGATDVALVWLPAPAGIAARPLLEDQRVAVMSADHPLATEQVVDPYALARQPFVWIDEMDANVRDYWTLGAYREGRPVTIGASITGFEDLLTAVRTGRAVSASPASLLAAIPMPDIVTRPIADLPPAVLAVCRRAGDDRPLVRAFLEVAEALADQPGRSADPPQ